MLISILSLALALTALLGAGAVLSRLFPDMFHSLERMILGFSALTFFSLVVGVFFASGSWVFQAPMLACSLYGVFLVFKNFRRSSMGEAAFYLLLFLGCAILANRGWMHIDSGGYHAQMVKWLVEYPVVPGLGNLHSRYAFNSIWHTYSAALAFPGFGISGAFISGASLAFVLIAFLRSLVALAPIGVSRETKTVSALFLCSVTLVHAGRRLVEGQIGTPSTDFPAMAFTMLFFAALLVRPKGEGESRFSMSEGRCFFVLSLFAMAVSAKLSIAPVILVFLPFARSVSKRVLAFLGAFAGVWIFRTFLLSGCLVYPMKETCFSTSWAMPVDSVASEYQTLRAWGRIAAPENIEGVLSSRWGWLSAWSKQAFSEELAVVWAAVVALSAFLILASLMKRSARAVQPNRFELTFALAVSYVALAFWFVQAPALRYGYGVIVVSGALSLAFACAQYEAILRFFDRARVGKWLAFACLSVFLFKALYNAKGIKVKHFEEAWPKFPEVALKEFKTPSGLRVTYPEKDGLCWNAPLSERCTPEPKGTIEEKVLYGRPAFISLKH